MHSRSAPPPGISGRPDIGRMATMIITGCLELGSWRRSLVCFGHRVIGVLAKAFTSGMPVTGDHTSAFTAELTTAMATPEWASGEANGAEENLSTIAR